MPSRRSCRRPNRQRDPCAGRGRPWQRIDGELTDVERLFVGARDIGLTGKPCKGAARRLTPGRCWSSGRPAPSMTRPSNASPTGNNFARSIARRRAGGLTPNLGGIVCDSMATTRCTRREAIDVPFGWHEEQPLAVESDDLGFDRTPMGRIRHELPSEFQTGRLHDQPVDARRMSARQQGDAWLAASPQLARNVRQPSRWSVEERSGALTACRSASPD